MLRNKIIRFKKIYKFFFFNFEHAFLISKILGDKAWNLKVCETYRYIYDAWNWVGYETNKSWDQSLIGRLYEE